MKRPCDSCGRPYDAKRASSRFCSDTCRKRAQRNGESGPKPASEPQSGGTVVQATAAELDSLGLRESRLGQQALRLAQKLESAFDTGSATASVSRELDRIMDKAIASVGKAGDSVDEMKARRDAKRDRAFAG